MLSKRIENIKNSQRYPIYLKRLEQLLDESNLDLEKKLSLKPGIEKFLEAFLLLEEQFFKEREAEELRRKLIKLKKREPHRQYASFATMVPFGVFMAIELTSICSGWVLFSIISGALSHLIVPFTVLSLICTLYLICNNRNIAQKEQELRDSENGEIAGKEEKNVPYNIGDYMNCADAILTMLVVIASIASEVLGEGIIEDTALLSSNLFGFITSAAFCYDEYNKSREHEAGKENHSHNDEKSKKNTNSISAAKLMLAGSSIMLIKRIMLMALASSLTLAFGPALGLVGIIALFMAGQVLIMRSYSDELTNVKVAGTSASLGASNMTSNMRRGYRPTEVGVGMAL